MIAHDSEFSGEMERTVRRALQAAQRALLKVAERPSLEAALLLAHVLQRPRTHLYAYPEFPLTPQQWVAYQAAVQRRVEGEPLPYILGEWEFFGLPFSVTPDVLIPRPETELLVEGALAWLEEQGPQHRRVADVGTGSGCVAVALAVHAPDVRIWATDISLAALRVAQGNAARHGVSHALHFVQGDLLAPIAPPVDVIVSNPPYVTEAEWETLPPNVRCEPRSALLAGAEGLDAVRPLLQQARARLRAPGLLLVEIGAGQGEAVLARAREVFADAASQITLEQDLAGKDRVLRVQL